MTEQSDHYTVLARRFRPQTFEDVIGQQHIAQALQNAITSGRVAHAYLFTGARGVGKTSTARILAKALNCPTADKGVPCNTCDICEGIAAGNDVDVLEIDGASNRGIDDIRSLRANVNVKSMRTKFKLYIIDEVHMLTREAFNALLKTLEEPPPNVKFVFCTTEPNKVPDTILSRCQRFDFATIETTNIVGRLQTIAKAEGFEVEPAALELVARRAAGSMRDSQSLFDQLLAFSEGKIGPDDVHRLLGTASDDRLVGIFDAVIERRRSDVLSQLDQSLSEGVQLNELLDQLLSYARDLMVTATDAQSVGLLAVSVSNRQTVADQADRWGLETIVAAMQILADTKNRIARTTFGRALVELAMVRISMLEDLTKIGQLLASLPADANAPFKPTKDGGKKKVEPPAAQVEPTAAPHVTVEVPAPAHAGAAEPVETESPAPMVEPVRPEPTVVSEPPVSPPNPEVSQAAASPSQSAPPVVPTPPAAEPVSPPSQPVVQPDSIPTRVVATPTKESSPLQPVPPSVVAVVPPRKKCRRRKSFL